MRGKKYDPNLIIWFIKIDDMVQINEIMLAKIDYYDYEEGYSNWNRAMRETYEELGEENIIAKQNKYINDLLSNYSGHLIFMTLPNFDRDKISEIMDSNSKKISLLELPNIYKYPSLFYRNDYHPTVKGHRAIAESMHEYLSTSKFIPCN